MKLAPWFFYWKYIMRFHVFPWFSYMSIGHTQESAHTYNWNLVCTCIAWICISWGFMNILGLHAANWSESSNFFGGSKSKWGSGTQRDSIWCDFIRFLFGFCVLFKNYEVWFWKNCWVVGLTIIWKKKCTFRWVNDLFLAELFSGDSKSAYHSPVERRSLVVESRKVFFLPE